MKRVIVLTAALFFVSTLPAAAQKDKKPEQKSTLSASTFSALSFRSIGPALTSGRIADFAVNPNDHSEYYVGVASGGIWKTTNNGTTYQPIFDSYGAYAIGCLAMDPNNSNVVWAGTGENNSQRALGYGDGVYKTVNGGKSWKNMGLTSSRQVGKILIDPRDSDVVYVAAEGSVWGPGGERGLYKTTDGGKTWNAVLTVSENTGVSDMVMDSRDPDLLIVCSHQRRRHAWTKIDGGPETAIYKTTDSGKNWQKLSSGLPSDDMGAIGLAISPVNPDYVYAIIEAAGESSGFFRSVDRGETWTKMGTHVSSSPQYYNEIFCDPVQLDKVYSMNTVTQLTEDGGKTWRALGNNERHVDDHALWIDPDDTRHLLIGGDGGVYETFDAGANWLFKTNLPITQFYRVAVDNSLPFYYVYGGTQDNGSMGGPSRTTAREIYTQDWFITNGGDGFWSQIDPGNPDIVYAESQYGGMVRFDRKSGESISITPQERKGEYTYRWNWNTPIIISPHSPTRLYVGANKVFRSEDRGNSWKTISDDLTRQLDRNKMPVMGRVWSIDAVAKNASTSLYGAVVSLAESPVQEDLLYAGTDDGLIQVSEDGGGSWQKIETFPGIPELTYVSDICPSKHDANVVYASFDNIKRDDFKPYLLMSTDKGKSWKSIASNLPENGTVHTIEQDHVNSNLLFAGTEFGCFFSLDGGEEWVQLKSGLPTIAVRDMVIQQRENDLVIATFGRGFYMLDDYTPLRVFKKEILDKEAHIFPIKDALMYFPGGGKGDQGSTFFSTPNPAVGATFTYYVKDAPETLRQIRKKKEEELWKANQPIPYPTWDELRAEENQEAPYLLFTIYDDADNVIRTMTANSSKGMKRITWDLRDTEVSEIRLQNNQFNPRTTGGGGNMVLPGTYKVSLSRSVNGVLTELLPPQEFNVMPLENTTLPPKDRAVLFAFQKKAAKLSRAVTGTISAASELATRIAYVKQAVQATPDTSPDLMAKARTLEAELQKLQLALTGDRLPGRYNENPPTSISVRLSAMALHGRSTSDLTQTEQDAYKIVEEEFAPIYSALKRMYEVDIVNLEKELDKIGAPNSPGRFPVWNK